MVETFTSRMLEDLANDTTSYSEESLNAEDEVFYATLQQPLNNLLLEPSQESIDAILKFSAQNRSLIR
ncbi:hypothetical protein [Olivibacter sp. XZL3]|uniref:hypothetical protein n=1 Tax=Olivibacter sp. XZL3 TaxID=1735116 RepID=UPI0010668E57|nr:hypothetical protein [Olivibacter sp. XZL3]